MFVSWPALTRVAPFVGFAAVAFFLICAPAHAAEIRIAQLYGLGYLPVHVVVERQLIEAQAAAAGLPPVTVTPVQLSGGPTANDLLLSGQIDVAMGGVTVLMALWERTRATRNPV